VVVMVMVIVMVMGGLPCSWLLLSPRSTAADARFTPLDVSESLESVETSHPYPSPTMDSYLHPSPSNNETPPTADTVPVTFEIPCGAFRREYARGNWALAALESRVELPPAFIILFRHSSLSLGRRTITITTKNGCPERWKYLALH
jgi:hypothetical protein